MGRAQKLSREWRKRIPVFGWEAGTGRLRDGECGRELWTQLEELGSPEKSGQLLTRPSQTAHFCGLRFKTKGNTLRFSPARGASPPSGFQMPPPRGGTPAPLCCRPPLSLSGELSICPVGMSTLQVRLTKCGRGACGQPPARVCCRPRRPRAGRPGDAAQGVGVCWLVFIL